MEELRDLAARVDAAAAVVASAASHLDDLDASASVFAVDAPGHIGEAGRDLHAQWVGALAARAREAAAAEARLAETASTLRIIEAGYADSDASAGRRLAEDIDGRA
jgi:hypothetical protein